MPNPTRVEICCADHDHATHPDCVHGVKEAIIELTDAEVAQHEAESAAFLAARETEETAKAEAKAAVLAKLGITEDELRAALA